MRCDTLASPSMLRVGWTRHGSACESVQLRRAIGLMPGVAANLVGLTYTAGQGGRGDARALAAEADAITEASGAYAILRQVEEART